MKLKAKIAAVMTAAALFGGAVEPIAFAESSERWNTPELAAPREGDSGDNGQQTGQGGNGGNSQTVEPAVPSLGSGAFSGGYSTSVSKVKKDDTVTIRAVAYIPIDHFKEGLTTTDFDVENIFGIASVNESFNPLTPHSWEWNSDRSQFQINGSFLCVTLQFNDVKYLGVGNTFSYSLCYGSGSASVTAPISFTVAECEEYQAPEEEEKTPVVNFTLDAGTSYTVKAGETKTITARLRAVNTGAFVSATSSATLTSSDASLIVEETGAKTSISTSPSFSFRVSAPKTAVAGTYTLTLNTTVYGSDGAITAQQSYPIPVTVTSDVVPSGLTVSGYKISKEPVKDGDSFTLSLTLKNETKIDLEDIRVSLDGLDSGKFVLDGGFSTQSVNIAAGKTGTVTFPLVACGGIANIRESIPVRAEYRINPADASTAQSLSTSVIVECETTSGIITSGLSVSDYKISKEPVKDGDSFTLSLTLENGTKIDLKDVKVTLDGLDSSKFVLDGGFSAQSVDIPTGKKKTVKFPLVACGGIANVRESIPVRAEYRTGSGSAAEQSLTTSVIVECSPKTNASSGKYDISLTDYSFSSNAVAAGTKFTLAFTLANTSSADLSGRVSLMEVGGGKFAIDSGLTYANFDIKAGKSQSFSFPLVGCDGIASIREVIPLEISFGEITSTAYTTVTCVPSPEAVSGETFAPAIIIESYDFGSDYVVGGTTFPLSLSVKNAGADAAIENLKITISGGPGNGNNGVAFSPANSSNSFFIERLAPKATTDIKIDLLPRADANPDSYPVNVTFEYEYLSGGKRAKAQTVTETITIPLQQEDRFTINPPEYPETAGIGEMAYLSASFINKGKSAVYNVTVDFEGDDFTKSSGTYYIGNVESGSQEYYDVQITPNVEGTVKGEIVVTYEDANGTAKEQRKEISMEVVNYGYGMMDDVVYDDSGMMGGEDYMMTEGEGEGSMTWLWFVIGGVVVAVVAVIIIVAVVKRKKKRELEMDDEDL
ncbi:MAG: hypothetical protein NC084_01235 [Bacteroides sp.]|nr:hypothetical protein [Eubacterium sp.]MCM1417876.1 hypothetical protein [Roseburia sp.]MCM1461315.1 hypothetical protein [Bacteroides sp.]